MFTSSAHYYDKIYSFKDYQAEARELATAIAALLPNTPQPTLLDVGAGTAEHHRFMPKSIVIEGFDLQPEFVEIARAKNPSITYHVADMLDFDFGTTYDVVACMFSSIGYMKTYDKMQAAIGQMAKHVSAGGVLIVEPWFTPDGFSKGYVSQVTVDEPELQICRMTYSDHSDDKSQSILNFHYTVAQKDVGMVHFDEQHVMGLYTEEQMLEAMGSAGLVTRFVSDSGIPRGVYIGRKEK